ncbi:putative B3 domain-containing protein REM15 [Lycium barbarum]|uniref:putative B3 domain-containing protein REM15 n=1 Tax=Lycium barbarum TaxID=112863 RepID=UPI00293E1F69|nr:putative B3 domain-containing protein REM15 [Lycium barbarum]XP_060169130.1 putative B3 domain-containing protein REM15 [Lycium barbarum]
MQVDPNKHPSFCNLLFKEGFMDKILMPPAFIKEHKKMLAKTCLLKTNAAEGMLWEANIVKEKSYFFLCGKEWPQFVMHHKLVLGDILLFFLIDKSMFQVHVYTQKSHINDCRGQILEELSSSSEEQQDNGIGPSRRSKRIKTEPKEFPGVVKNEEAESESEENGPKKIRFNVVNLSNKDPYYKVVIKKSHSTYMAIPISFARWTSIFNMKRMTLVNEKGKEWRVDIVHDHGGGVRIRRGWAAFRKDNNISYGETYIFKLIRGNDGRKVLLVQKIPKPHSLR